MLKKYNFTGLQFSVEDARKTISIDLHAKSVIHKHKYSFWDSMIIQAAIKGGAKMLLSDNLYCYTIKTSFLERFFEQNIELHEITNLKKQMTNKSQ